VPPDELRRAELWGEDGAVPASILKTHLWLLARRAARKKLDVRFMLSGAKGFHILLTLERPVPAEWRPAIAKKLAEWLDVEADPATFDPARKLRIPWTVHTETGRLAVFVDPKTLEPIEFDWPRPIPYDLAKTLAALGRSDAWSAPRPKPEPRRGGWVPLLEKVAAENPGLKSDCRKRFSALFGCACAVDGLDAESCIKRLAAALGLDEMSLEYLSAMKRGLEVCSKRIAEGQKPLFSIRRALTLDVGEGEGKVWYSVRECITAKPSAVPPPAEGAVQAAAEGGEEAPAAAGGEEQAPPEAYAQDDVRQEVSEAVLNGGGEEEAWEELEEFIAAHRAAGAEQQNAQVPQYSDIEVKSKDEILKMVRELLRKHGALRNERL
jgi:hypothetical protein